MNEKCAVDGCEADGPCRVFSLGKPANEKESRGLCIKHFNEFNQFVMKEMTGGGKKWLPDYLATKTKEAA